MEGIFAFFALLAVALVTSAHRAKKAGPRQVSDETLARGRPLVRLTAESPGPGWSELGRRTTADGLRLRFDADDDPLAEAKLFVPRHERAGRNRFGHSRVVTLGSDWATEHVHTGGYAFQVRVRGTGATVGKKVEIQMKVGSNGEPYGASIENDDDHDPAIGDWIDIALAEILRLPPNGR